MTILEDYNRDGYAVKERFFDSFIPLARAEKTLSEEKLKGLFKENKDNYIRYLSAMAKSVELQQMMLRISLNGFLGFRNSLIIEQPVLHVMSPDLRIPDGYYGTAPHQDWTSTQGSLDCVTVWIALTDAGVDNFPMEVIPGSHKLGLLDGKMNGSVLEVEVDEKEFKPIECKAGDVVFLSGFLVHRTGKGDGFRVAVSQRFDNADESTFVKRGYPCAQKRVVDREIRWKPAIEQVRNCYVD